MLEELPGLAERLKVFVRENPSKEHFYSETQESRQQAFAVHTANQLVSAAKAGRSMPTFPVMNDSLSLADLRSYENRVNTVPVGVLPGSGSGLVRVLSFRMDRDPASFIQGTSVGRIWANLEYSPLGWPELPDMAEADLNVLFEESTPRRGREFL